MTLKKKKKESELFRDFALLQKFAFAQCTAHFASRACTLKRLKFLFSAGRGTRWAAADSIPAIAKNEHTRSCVKCSCRVKSFFGCLLTPKLHAFPPLARPSRGMAQNSSRRHNKTAHNGIPVNHPLPLLPSCRLPSWRERGRRHSMDTLSHLRVHLEEATASSSLIFFFTLI